MTSIINDDNTAVQYSTPGWQTETRFGGVHVPTTVNDPQGAELRLEFDGTGVAVMGYVDSTDHDNIQDIFRCTVDNKSPSPSPLSNAQVSVGLTLCQITSLPSAHHTLIVQPGTKSAGNGLIDSFVIFSERTSTQASVTQNTSPTSTTPEHTPPRSSPTPTSTPDVTQQNSPSTTSNVETAYTSNSSRTYTSNVNSLSTIRPSASGASSTDSPDISTPSSLDPTARSSSDILPQWYQPSSTLIPGGPATTSSVSGTLSHYQRHTNMRAIAGGVAGGIIFLLLVLAIVFSCRRRLREVLYRLTTRRRLKDLAGARVGAPEQDKGRGERSTATGGVRIPANAWSPGTFSVQSPSHSLSPNSLDYAFTRPFSLASSVYPDMQAQSHSSDSRRSSTKPLLSSALRGNSRTSTGTAASTNEDWHDAQSSASAEDLSMRSVPSRQSWYAV